ncbi:MAG TPA: nucleotidyltransferase domain-containing protein [bacterium]|nr:nucleotidyltransferase domain-containing protein [bacterium]
MRKLSYGSVKVFWLDRAEALRRLEDAAKALLAARPDVVAVYVFGSLPEGRAVPGSDADVLLLLRETSQRFIDRPLEFAPFFAQLGLPVDVFCYTADEAARNPFARRARERGIVLAQRASAPLSPPEA